MHIFYCASEKFGKVVGVPDAVRRGTGRWPLGSGVLSVLGPIRVKHRTQGVPCSCVRCGLSSVGGFLTKSTGRLGCVRWCESGVQAVCNPLCA